MTVKCVDCNNFNNDKKGDEFCEEDIWYMFDEDYPNNTQQLKEHINAEQFCSSFEEIQ